MKLSDLLFDRRCCICNRHIKSGAVCGVCDDEIRSHVNVGKRIIYLSTTPAEVTYLFEYNVPIVKKLIFSLKHSANKDLFLYASGLYEMAVPKGFEGTVINCPRRGVSVRNYGYDQVEKPCRMMCKNSNGSLRFMRLVARKGLSKEQKKLTKTQRIDNTAGSFKVIKKDVPKNILIVDDIVTTGSTASACAAEILKQRKDASIKVACLASRNIFTREG